MKYMKHLIIYTLVAFFSGMIFSGCKKTEGEGGLASVSGKLHTKEYYKDRQTIISEYYQPDEDVFIVYGDDETISDNTKTDQNGFYRFKYLQPGNYTVFAYSDDLSGMENSGKKVVSKTITVAKRKEDVSVPDLEIADIVDFNDGNSTITGKVYCREYNYTFTSILGEYFAPEEWVYLIYNNESSFCERVRTGYDGTFVFSDLIKGHYEVFAYSDDSTMQSVSGVVPVTLNADIISNMQEIELPVLRILKR